MIKSNRNKLGLLAVFCFCYVTVDVFGVLLRFDPLQSDARDYWEDSLNLAAPFDPFHVPGYPVAIAALRIITRSMFSPAFYMRAISFLSFSLALYLVFKIGLIYTGSESKSLLTAILFMLWPMVGLTYVIYPVADSLAMCMYLLGLYLLLTRRELLSGLAWASTLFVHKAMWVFVALSFAVWAWHAHRGGIKEILSRSMIIFGPLMVYAIIGSIYHDSYTWIVSSNLMVEVSSNREFFLLYGLLQTLSAGTLAGMTKGSLLLLHMFVAAYVVWHALNRRAWGWEYCLTIGLAILILIFVLNSHEIWACVRFGRLLVIPLMIGFSSVPAMFSQTTGRARGLTVLLLISLYASQYFYAWYMSVYFARAL